MYKTFFIGFIFFLSLLQVVAQVPANESQRQLLAQIQKSKPDTNRVKLLLALSKEILQEHPKDIDSSYNLMKQAEQLSLQLKDIKSQANTYLLAASISYKKGDMTKGLKLSKQALAFFIQINDLNGEAEAYIIIGQYYGSEGKDLDKKIAYYKKAKDIFESNGSKEQYAATLVDLADFQGSAEKYEESIKNLRITLSVYQSIGYTKLQRLYDLLGTDLGNMGDVENSIRYELMALNTAEALKDTTIELCTIYNRLGLSYYNLHKWDKALASFEKGLVIAHTYADSSSIAIISMNKVDVFNKMNQPQKGVDLLKSIAGMSNFKKSLEDKISLNWEFLLLYLSLKQYKTANVYFIALQSLSKPDATMRDYALSGFLNYYLATGQYQRCYPYLIENKALLEKKKSLLGLSRNELFWFKADSGLGKYQSAIRHYQQYKLLTDSNFTLAKNKQTSLLQIQFETERKDKDLLLQSKNIQLLKKQSQLRESEFRQTRTSRNWIMGGSVMLLLLLGVGYNRYRLKQRSNIQLQSKQHEINQQNIRLQRLITEKDWLLKEVHHRVKNNLQIVMSLLSTQSAYLENTAALNAISESRNRVQAISLIHQKLYSTSNVASIDMQTYISDLINYLNDCLDASSQGIRFEQLVEPVKIDLGQAVPLGLILNEAITNAIKYAFVGNGGSIFIALQLMSNENLLLTITDNGKGLPADFDVKNTSSLGMEMMKALSKQLGGNFLVKGNQGVTITIEFQIEKVLNQIQAESFYS